MVKFRKNCYLPYFYDPIPISSMIHKDFEISTIFEKVYCLGTVHILRHPPRGREGVLEKMTGEGVFELDDVILKIEILEEKLSNF